MILKMHRPVLRDYEWQEQLRYQRHKQCRVSAGLVPCTGVQVMFKFLDVFLCRTARTWLSVGWLVEKSRCAGFYKQKNSSTGLKINDARRSASHPLGVTPALVFVFFGNGVLQCWINTTEMLSQSGFHHLKEAHCRLTGIILPNEASPPVVQICRLVLHVTKDDLGGVRWRRLSTGTGLPADDCDLPCPRSLPAIPRSLDQSSGASWFLPLWQSWDSEACLPRCINGCCF